MGCRFQVSQNIGTVKPETVLTPANVAKNQIFEKNMLF
jgi:hypothetical protein